MGGTEASEPELSPAYVAMHEAYRRVSDLERIARRRASIRSAMATEYDHLKRLWSELEAEEAELTAAESKAGRLTLPPLRRRRVAAADRERADVDAVRAELIERQRIWEELSVSLGPAPGYDLDVELAAAQAALDRAMAAWQTAHRQGGSALADWLDMSERASGEVEALMAEVEEAADLVLQAYGTLMGATRAVIRPTAAQSMAAHAWLMLGPARYSDHAEQNAIVAATGSFRRSLLRLEPELRDLYRPARADLAPPPSLQRALDAWFDGAFSRWLATGQLNLTLSSVADGKDQFDHLRAELQAFHRLLQRTLDGIEEQRATRLLEHPGMI